MDAKTQAKPLDLKKLAAVSPLVAQIKQQLENGSDAAKLWTEKFEASGGKDGQKVG